MPVTAHRWQVPRLPRFLVVLVPLGMILMGWGMAERVSPLATDTVVATVVRHGHVETIVQTVERKVHGRIIHVRDKVYVRVPLVVIHIHRRTIKVPAHKLPLRSSSALVASPLVTIHIPVPVATTIYLPTTVYSTVTSTDTVTDTVPTTITSTVTLPL